MSTLKVINIVHPSGGSNTVSLDTSGNLTVPGNIIGGSSIGMRNRIINGGMAIDQRNAGAAQTITAAAALAYTVDRWYAYCTGANVTGQRVASTGTAAEPSRFGYRFTGAASVTAIGFGQRIEAINCYDMAGTTATLSVNLSNSLLTTVTWTAYYATTADTFGTLASPTRTQIATGTFTVNSTLTRYSTQISIPAAATTGIEIVFTVGAQTSGTWVIGNVQLEEGTINTNFERRHYGQELQLCQRYFCKSYAQSVVPGSSITGTYFGLVWTHGVCDAGAGQVLPIQAQYPITMRTTGTVTYWDTAGNISKYSTFTGGAFTRTDNVGAMSSIYQSDIMFGGYISPGVGNSGAIAWQATAEL